MKAAAIKEVGGKTWAPQTAAWREEGEEEEKRQNPWKEGREGKEQA